MGNAAIMKISFVLNPIFTGEKPGFSPWDTRVGGSEEMVIETSKQLAKQGHDVMVYHNGQHGTYKNVAFRDHEDYKPGDITINVNFPQFKVQGPTIFWTSLTEHPDLSAFNAICVISEYAKYNTGVKHRNIHIVSPGYEPKEVYPKKKIPKQCFYASSPDRGLNTLLEAWPKVYKHHPDATLIVTYGGSLDLPGVMNLGEITKDEMNEVYRTSDIWCHPCNGGELFCITGKKAQVSGCIPVIIPTMALNETVRRGYKVEEPKDYAQALIEVLDTPMKFRDIIRKDVIKNAYAHTWEECANQLLAIMENVLKSE